MAFKLDALNSQYACFDALPEAEKTYKRLRALIQTFMNSENAVQRFESVLDAKSDKWDGITNMGSWYDVVKG